MVHIMLNQVKHLVLKKSIPNEILHFVQNDNIGCSF